MTRTAQSLAFSFILTVLVGCHSDIPTTPAPQPKALAQPTNEKPDPNNRDCAAIKDPAQAEDCRLWKGIAAAKKKHNSDPAVKRSPGSIQQP